MPARVLVLRGWVVPAVSIQNAMTAFFVALLTWAATYFGAALPAKDDAKGRAVAQDQCCPIARTCVERLGE